MRRFELNPEAVPIALPTRDLEEEANLQQSA